MAACQTHAHKQTFYNHIFSRQKRQWQQAVQAAITPGLRHTMRFGSTAKILAKCMLKYYKISEWDRAWGQVPCMPPRQTVLAGFPRACCRAATSASLCFRLLAKPQLNMEAGNVPCEDRSDSCPSLNFEWRLGTSVAKAAAFYWCLYVLQGNPEHRHLIRDRMLVPQPLAGPPLVWGQLRRSIVAARTSRHLQVTRGRNPAHSSQDMSAVVPVATRTSVRHEDLRQRPPRS